MPGDNWVRNASVFRTRFPNRPEKRTAKPVVARNERLRTNCSWSEEPLRQAVYKTNIIKHNLLDFSFLSISWPTEQFDLNQQCLAPKSCWCASIHETNTKCAPNIGGRRNCESGGTACLELMARWKFHPAKEIIYFNDYLIAKNDKLKDHFFSPVQQSEAPPLQWQTAIVVWCFESPFKLLAFQWTMWQTNTLKVNLLSEGLQQFIVKLFLVLFSQTVPGLSIQRAPETGQSSFQGF